MTVKCLELPDPNKTWFLSTTQGVGSFLNQARCGSSRSLVAVVTDGMSEL